MKVFITIGIMMLCQIVYSQPQLLLEANEQGPDREMLIVSNLNNSTLSNTRVSLFSAHGLANEAGLELVSFSKGYTAIPGYDGYGSLTNRQSGLVLRAFDTNGDIRMITGGADMANQTRMYIDPLGLVGIGTDLPASKLQIEFGDVYIKEDGRGLIMKSPNGNCWLLGVSNAGSPSFTSHACPN